MKEETPRPQINSAKIRIGGGLAAALFTVASMLIFLTGLPVLRFLFPAAIVLGCVVAVILRFARREPMGTSWLLSAAGDGTERPHEPESKRDLQGFFSATPPLTGTLRFG